MRAINAIIRNEVIRNALTNETTARALAKSAENANVKCKNNII